MRNQHSTKGRQAVRSQRNEVTYTVDLWRMLIDWVPTKRELKMFSYRHGLTLLFLSSMFLVTMLVAAARIVLFE